MTRLIRFYPYRARVAVGGSRADGFAGRVGLGWTWQIRNLYFYSGDFQS